MNEIPTQPIDRTQTAPLKEPVKISHKEKQEIQEKMYRILDDRQELFQPLCKEGMKESDSIHMTNIHADGALIVADGFLVNENGATYGTGLSYQINVGTKSAQEFEAEIQTLKKIIFDQPQADGIDKHKIFEEEARKKFEERFIKKAATLHAKWHGYLSNGVQFRPSATDYLPRWDEKDTQSMVVGINYTILGAEKTLRPGAQYQLESDGKNQVIDATARLAGLYEWDKLENIIMDGHSMGGNVCYWVAMHESELTAKIHNSANGKRDPDKTLRIHYVAKTPVIGGKDVLADHVKVLENVGLILEAAAKAPWLLDIGDMTPVNAMLLKNFIPGDNLHAELSVCRWQAKNDKACFVEGTKELKRTPLITQELDKAYRSINWRNTDIARILKEKRMWWLAGGRDRILSDIKILETADKYLIPIYKLSVGHFYDKWANGVYKALHSKSWQKFVDTTYDWFSRMHLPHSNTKNTISQFIQSYWRILPALTEDNLPIEPYLKKAAGSGKSGQIRWLDELAFSLIHNNNQPDATYPRSILLSGLQEMGFVVLTDTDTILYEKPTKRLSTKDTDGQPMAAAKNLQSWLEQQIALRKKLLDLKPEKDLTSEDSASLSQLTKLSSLFLVIKPSWLNSEEAVQGFSDKLAERLCPKFIEVAARAGDRPTDKTVKDGISGMTQDLIRNSPLEPEGLVVFWDTIKTAFPELLRKDKPEFSQLRNELMELYVPIKLKHKTPEWQESLEIWVKTIRLLQNAHMTFQIDNAKTLDSTLHPPPRPKPQPITYLVGNSI